MTAVVQPRRYRLIPDSWRPTIHTAAIIAAGAAGFALLIWGAVTLVASGYAWAVATVVLWLIVIGWLTWLTPIVLHTAERREETSVTEDSNRDEIEKILTHLTGAELPTGKHAKKGVAR